MISKQRQIGKWLIQSIKNDIIINEETIFNRITDLGLNTWADALVGTASDIEIKFLALGTDDSVLDDTDTQLGVEVFRTQDTALSRTATGITQSEFFLLDSEALNTIKEIGIFCGSTATSSADTGLMLSRILWDSDRTSGATSVRFIRVDTFERK